MYLIKVYKINLKYFTIDESFMKYREDSIYASM